MKKNELNLAIALIIALFILLGGYSMRGFGTYGMMGRMYGYGFMGLFGLFFMGLVFIALVLLIIWLSKSINLLKVKK